MKWNICFVLVCLFSHTVFADVSLRDQAEKETSVTDPKILSQIGEKPEVQVSSGAMVLEDPFAPLELRTFIWSFALEFQSYQPAGIGSLADQTHYDLSQAGESIMPRATLGTLYNLGKNNLGCFQFGVNTQLGYSGQSIEASTSNAYPVKARLSTTQAEANLQIRWARNLDSKFHFTLESGIGNLSVSQSSQNSIARWSESALYRNTGAGIEYAMSKTWLSIANYTKKELRDSQKTLKIQQDNLAVGAKVLW